MSVETIEIQDLKQLLEDDNSTILIDVREPHEWQAGHIAAAKHLPMAQVASSISETVSDKEQTVYLQCKSGGRSMQVANLLVEMGYSKVVNVEGGIIGWMMAGYPVEK